MIINVWEYANGSFSKIHIIDDATSIIWKKCFRGAGFFELYIRATSAMFEMFTRDNIFITRDDTSGAMCVEKIQLHTDETNGDYLIITGKSAESLIGRRIIPVQTNLTGTAENAIYTLLDDNAIMPTDTARALGPFVVGTTHGWTETIDLQITGKNLLDAIVDICKTYNYGFRVTFEFGVFTFELYKGVDRSFDQSENTFVVFSTEFENLGNTDYARDLSTYYNGVFVGGEGEGSERVIVSVRTTGKSGFNLREKWVDARTTSAKTESGTLTPTQYKVLLTQRGNEEIKISRETTTFSGEIIDNNKYVYGVDYELGDKISVKNEYGIVASAVISEITEVEDANGRSIYPTLSEWSV